MIYIERCPKLYTRDQDKAISPEITVLRVKEVLGRFGLDILSETRRIDTGRLGIPVYMSVCGKVARRIMPTRKQMGKGVSAIQAEASALMELVERFSFFTFWSGDERFISATFSEAEALAADGVLIGDHVLPSQAVIPLSHILASVGEAMLDYNLARQLLDMVPWRFYLATNLAAGREEWVPLDWFKRLGEFNGSSAGNTPEESILQGGCELVERHVCAVIDRYHPTLPTINPATLEDQVLAELYACFTRNGLKVLLKDFTLDMPVPTVGAVVWDPATFPELSEIVFTAGTATSPTKAAIRALTEVAQLGGDFNTSAVYEASGLSKFAALEELEWLRAGPIIPLGYQPSIEDIDIGQELQRLVHGLAKRGYSLYSVDISHPELRLAAHYSFVPGFQFRERDRHASLGLFVGRMLAEELLSVDTPKAAEAAFALLEVAYGRAHFLPFFRAIYSLRSGNYQTAANLFRLAEPLQPDADSRGLAAFYAGYAGTMAEDWASAMSDLDRAVQYCAEVKEYWNLRGVTRYKLGLYAEAVQDFRRVLDIDCGSAVDLANLGICHHLMDQPEKAIHFLATALTLEPNLEFARQYLDNLTGNAVGKACNAKATGKTACSSEG